MINSDLAIFSLPKMISNEYKNGAITGFKEAFANHKDAHCNLTGASLSAFPFRSILLPNFIQDQDRLIEIKNAILSTEFLQKSNDLYDFYQSNDLKHSSHAIIQEFLKDLFSPEWINLLSKLTGLSLSSTVDVSAQKYPPRGYLQCHDDDMGNAADSRRIAFILYLVDQDWSPADGGHLQLFNTQVFLSRNYLTG